MNVKCPFCGGSIEVLDEQSGVRVECSTCLALVDPALAKSGSHSESRPAADRTAAWSDEPGDVPGADEGGDDAVKAGSYSLKSENLATSREQIFPGQRPVRPAPPPADVEAPGFRPGAEPPPARHLSEDPLSGLLGDEFDSLGFDDLAGAADVSRHGATATPPMPPPPVEESMGFDLDFADLGPMDPGTTNNGLGGVPPSPGGRPVPPPDSIGPDAGTMHMGSIDMDAVMREDSVTDELRMRRPTGGYRDEGAAILTEGIGQATEGLGLDLGLDSWAGAPSSQGPGPSLDLGGSGPYAARDLPPGGGGMGLELELPPVPDVDLTERPAPVIAKAPAKAPKGAKKRGVDGPATGRASASGGSGLKVAVLGVILVVLVGAILGQTKYGWFGLNLLDGSAGGTARPARSLSSAPGDLHRDTRAAYVKEVDRLERQLKDDEKSLPLRVSLLETLLRFRERYPATMAADPKLSGRLRELMGASDLPPRGAILVALDLLGTGKPREALAVLGGISASSDDPAVPFLMGKAALAQDKADEAIRFLDVTLLKDPESLAARYFLAKAHQVRKDHARARALLDQVLQAEPEHLAARVTLAQISLAAGDLEGATRQAGEVLQKGTPGADSMELFQAHLVLSNVADAQGKVEDRLKELQAALAILPGDEDTAVRVAHLLLQSGKRGQSLEALTPCRQRGCAGEPFLAVFAQSAFEDEKEDLAEQALKEGEAKFPKSPVFSLIRGRRHLEADRVRAAVSSFEQALKVEPTAVEAWQLLGLALAREGKLSEAVTRLKEGLEATQGATALLMTMADIHREQRDYKAAEEVLKRAVVQEPRNAMAQQKLGLAIFAQGRAEDAVKVLATLEEKQSLEKNGIFGLAGAYLAMKQPARARDLLARLHQAEPEDADVAAEYGRSLGEAGDAKKAEEVLRQVTTDQPSHPQTHYYLGRLLARNGDLAKGVEELQRAVQLSGNDQVYRLELARTLLAQDTGESVRDAKNLLDIVAASYGRGDVPEELQEADAYMLRGRILFGEQKYQLAMKDFEAGLLLVPTRADLLAGYGRALFELARYDEAKAPFFQVLDRDPGNAEAHFYLGRILLRKKDTKGARDHLLRSVQRDAKAFPDAHRMLGLLYKDEGMVPLARKSFRAYLQHAEKGTAEYEEVQRMVDR